MVLFQQQRKNTVFKCLWVHLDLHKTCAYIFRLRMTADILMPNYNHVIDHALDLSDKMSARNNHKPFVEGICIDSKKCSYARTTLLAAAVDLTSEHHISTVERLYLI